MSHLQWLGIWGMTGFSKPENSDLDKWSKGITYLLADPKGLHYFKEFLSEPARNFEAHAQILGIWAECDKLINQGIPVISRDDARAVLDKARENLSMSSGELCQVELNINSGNEGQIRDEVIKMQEAARDDLNSVYSSFIMYSKRLNSSKKVKCLIL
ncbi:uncharacterized protein LOC110837641 isoform X2 [Zootermopsis nevadensis]|nr:uncharacterized protein LOC110837641 isoform X2 [Zootermopsis nevadensis]